MADNQSAVQQVLAAGVPQSFIEQQRTLGNAGSLNGVNLDPQDVQRTISAYSGSFQKKISDIASQEYSFDPNKYLPGIQKQAASIYDPQKAQLEAIRQLQSAQYQEARLQTAQDFDKQLKSEIESINNRGAYFSGGAVEREQELGDQKLRALQQLGLQAQAADFNNLMQQGLLSANEAQFIQDQLYNNEASAYARWTDQRNFSYQAAVQQYQIYSNERDYARSVFESDRQFELDTQELEMKQKQFEQNYNITSEQFKQAKEEFNVDMKIKKLSYESALDNFKNKYAIDNNGSLGIDSSGNDIEQNEWVNWDSGQSTQYLDWPMPDWVTTDWSSLPFISVNK